MADLEASRRFYESLGLTLQLERHGTGPAHLSANVGGAVLELYPRDGGAGSDGVRLGFTVPDLGAVVASLGEAVVSSTLRAGEVVTVALDPDGHRVELTPRPTRRLIPPG